MFHKIIVANRGEIALRIIRALKELGIKSVAVYSEADRESLPVKMADESVCIGPAEGKKSYLSIPALMSVAEITDSDAIHPGYGFLAENPEFAEVCANCGVTFIGPTSKQMRIMGNKIKARELAAKLKIPLLPGSNGPVKNEKEGLEISKSIGFPVILKASAGGGGRGMKVIYTPGSFGNSFLAAQSEVMAAFGDPDIYVEKYCEKAKHIEFQIVADKYKNVIHLGERDCSIQRRHQKIIEEAPSTALNEKLRNKMGKAAVELASSINYSSVGTVEFLLEENGNFYFMEMNTRIQVEHPVTEMITGIDLVKEQIKIAAGNPLKIRQKDLEFRGHAIECRINCECPETFTPSPGRINYYHTPGGIGIRVDSAVYAEYNVPPYYDSLLAKLIAYGSDREEAVLRMKRALEEFIIEGVKTNIPLHRKIMNDKDFLKGEVFTRFMEKYIPKDKGGS